MDKKFLVVYSIGIHSIQEDMYFADAVAIRGQKVSPIVLKELLDPGSKKSSVLLDNVRSAIAIATEYVDDCRLFYKENSENPLSLTDKNNKPITIEDIESDESYIIIKLLSLILTKGWHQGVIILDAYKFSDKTLEAFSAIAESYFEDTFIFVYNCRPDSEYRRRKIELPNFVTKRK
ncbi:hypothetical protein D3C71_1539420 [compost metagenome]